MSLTRRDLLARAGAVAVGCAVPACRPTPSERAAVGEFLEGAVRLHLRHQRASSLESFSVTRIRIEPKWAGPRQRLADFPDWGDYRLSLHDHINQAVLSRTGFDSLLDAVSASGSSQLSARFPLPARPVQIAIERRRPGNVFQQVANIDFRPDAPDIDRGTLQIATRVDTIFSHGDPESKVDLSIVGDGYSEAEYDKFVSDAKRAAGYLFAVEPFKKRMRDFNVRSVFAASPQSGVTDPYLGLRKDTALRCEYLAGELERTLIVGDPYALYEVASAAPADFVLVLANARRYGGSAHFGGPAVAAIDSAAAKYLVLHELAHVIGGLAEEYYIPAPHGPAFTGNVEPWHPNVTLAPDTGKWRAPDGAAPPAPWNKAQYDKEFSAYVKRYFALRERRADEALVERLMSEAAKRQAVLLAASGNARRVGFFEGAHGYGKGAYRSEANCIMFSLQTDYFCAACSAAIERMIDWHVG